MDIYKEVDEVVQILNDLRDGAKSKSLAYFGIEAEHVLGITMPQLRSLAKEIGKNQALAEALWQKKYHEAKLLAVLIAEHKKFTIETADAWVADIYSWDVCDQLCSNVLWKTDYAWQLTERWAPNENEFVRRAGIAMMAQLVVHQKKQKTRSYKLYCRG